MQFACGESSTNPGPQPLGSGSRRHPRAEAHCARAGGAREALLSRPGLASSLRPPAVPSHLCLVGPAGFSPPSPRRRGSRLRAQDLSGRRREGEAAGKKGLRPGATMTGLGMTSWLLRLLRPLKRGEEPLEPVLLAAQACL